MYIFVIKLLALWKSLRPTTNFPMGVAAHPPLPLENNVGIEESELCTLGFTGLYDSRCVKAGQGQGRSTRHQSLTLI